MSRRYWFGPFVAALLMIQSPAYGQFSKESGSDTAEVEPGTNYAPKHTPDLDRVKDEAFRATNRFRAGQKRGELKTNSKLSRAAQSFAEYMARTDKFSHTADGHEPWERCAREGYDYCIILENIAFEYNGEGFTSDGLAKALMQGWENSPPHRKNLLDPDVTEIGIGVALSKTTGRYYAVQDFGRPKADAVHFKITNRTDAVIKYTIDGKPFTISPRYTITHERCRPPELKVQWPENSDVAPGAKETFRPANGNRFVLRKDDSGRFAVEKK